MCKQNGRTEIRQSTGRSNQSPETFYYQPETKLIIRRDNQDWSAVQREYEERQREYEEAILKITINIFISYINIDT